MIWVSTYMLQIENQHHLLALMIHGSQRFCGRFSKLLKLGLKTTPLSVSAVKRHQMQR
jgi:hypothetical protein